MFLFVDEARIFVKAGNGGNGLVTFRREKYIPRGGPSGGDGGSGGSVVFVADAGLRTLLDFRYRQHFRASNGEPGGPKNQAGHDGDDLVVPVPPGTMIWNDETGELLGDLTADGQRAVVARGGRGGRGNARFATSTEQAPTFAEKGEPGQELTIRLELRLVADAGLIGLPNAGKSTFLSRVSAARPKIADYPFTTLAPNLGVVGVPGREGASFVLADIPGLIKGAHEGSGLGDKFLRHVQRTRVLVHLVDVSETALQDPVSAYADIRRELDLYDPVLAARTEIVVATKTDLPGAPERAKTLEAFVRSRAGGRAGGGNDAATVDGEDHGPVPRFFRASPLTGEGLTPVLHAIADVLASEVEPAGAAGSRVAAAHGDGAAGSRVAAAHGDGVAGSRVAAAHGDGVAGARAPRAAAGSRPAAAGFTVTRGSDGSFVVTGADVERAVVMTDLGNEFAVRHLQRRLKRRGVTRALRAAGARPGSTVRIGSFEFEFTE